MDRHYQRRAWIFTHVFPAWNLRSPIPGQEEKDFGSTYGGQGLSREIRREMYLSRMGGMVSYHNDQPRPDMDILTFKQKENPPDILLHHLYYDGETVLAAEREALALARVAKLKRLLTRHIPTGPGLDFILRSRTVEQTELPAEIGLDYLYFNRDMLPERSTSLFNYAAPPYLQQRIRR